MGAPPTAGDILGAFFLSSLAHGENSSRTLCVFKPRMAARPGASSQGTFQASGQVWL